jgi:hypothetical protein
MIKAVAVCTALAFVVMSTPAPAQDAAREACCKKLGGTWRTGMRRGYQAHYACYGLGGMGGTISNEFYKCVASGGRK